MVSYYPPSTIHHPRLTGCAPIICCVDSKRLFLYNFAIVQKPIYPGTPESEQNEKLINHTTVVSH